MSDAQVCEICGATSAGNAHACESCGCLLGDEQTRQAHFERRSREQGMPSLSDFGLRPADVNTAEFAGAERLLMSSFSEPGLLENPGFSRERVLENADIYYFPVGWVGCAGHLVVKEPLHLIRFGSYIGAGAHIWAYYQGISIEPSENDRRQTLRIVKVHDLERTIEALKSFLDPRRVDQQLVRHLASPPMDVEDVDLYFGIRELIAARHHAWFEYTVLSV